MAVINILWSECFALPVTHCNVYQTTVARILVKMAAHASTSSTDTSAGVKLATLARAAKQVRTIDAKGCGTG